MTRTFTRTKLGFAVAAVAMVLAGAGYQNLSAQAPGPGGPGAGRVGGPGGPGHRGPGGPQGPGFGPLAPMMLQRLDLTPDQHDRVRQILDSHRTDQQALFDREMKAREALMDAVTGTFDESSIRARAADVASVEADLAVAQARIYDEVVQILTPDQQQKLKQLQADMKQRQEQMRQQFEQNGGHPRGGRGARH